jgi:hypothetical protein
MAVEEVASMVVAAAVASMVAAAASTVGAEASMAAAAAFVAVEEAFAAAVLLADTMVAEHASRVEGHAFQVEAGILWLAALASRHLGCVRRQRFGRMPWPAIGGSQAVQMLRPERLTIAETVSGLSGRLRAFNQDASIARTSTGKITSSRATTVIGIAIGIGAVPIIGIIAGGVITAVTG